MSLYHGSYVLERDSDVSVISGHEPCGIIEKIGLGVTENMTHLGDLVAIYLAVGCGNCEYCRKGYIFQYAVRHVRSGLSNQGVLRMFYV